MKGRDDNTAWAEPDDGERLVTRVDSRREQRIVEMGPPKERPSGTPAWMWLALGSSITIVLFLMAKVYFIDQPAPATSQANAAAQPTGSASTALPPPPSVLADPDPTAVAVKPPTPPEPPLPLPTPPVASAPITSFPRSAGQPAALIPPPPVPPPGPGAGEQPGAAVLAEPNQAIIGKAVPLEKLTVEVEDYWVEKNPPTDVAYAALSGYISNNSTAAMALPQLDVVLMDADKREYKPSKVKLPSSVSLNPLMKAKGLWAFQVPAQVPMWCAVFRAKGGKAAYVGLTQRTPQNTELMASADYAAGALAAFASPRAALQVQYDEIKAKMAPDEAELDAAQKRFAKIEKRMKVCDDAVDAARTLLEKHVATLTAAQARLKDLEGSTAEFRHDQRTLDTQIARQAQAVQRADKDAAAAADSAKDKVAARAKVLAEAQDEVKRMKTLQTKLETQQKALDGIEKKMVE